MRKLLGILWIGLAVSCAAQTPFVIPQSAVLNATTREQNVSNLVLSINSYAVLPISGTNHAVTNLVNRSTAQIVDGIKTFRAANVYSNASQVITGGTLTNTQSQISTLIAGTETTGALTVKNAQPISELWDTAGGASNKRVNQTMDNGAWSFNFTADDGSAIISAMQLFKTIATFGVPARFDAGLDMNSGTMANALISDSTITNTVGGFLDLWATSANIAGNLGLTNGAPKITLYDSSGTADDKLTKIVASGDNLLVNFYNDAGTLISQPLIISRTAGVATAINLAALVNVTGGMLIQLNPLNVDDSIRAANLVVSGSITPTIPASMTAGFLSVDGTGPTADPTTGAALWTDGNGWKYRTSIASEGSGGTQRIHNRESTVSGTGTDYNLTASTAAIDFGTTDPVVTMPTDGKYLIQADIRFTNGATAADAYAFKLRNTTTSTDLVSDWLGSCAAASQVMQITIQGTMVCAAGDSITIYGNNNSAAVHGTVNSAGTRIRYIRLH